MDKNSKEDWDGWKKEYLMCENKDCKDEMYVTVRVKEGWKAKEAGKFTCGICLERKGEKVIQLQEKMEKQIHRLEEKVKEMEKKMEKENKEVSLLKIEAKKVEEIKKQVDEIKDITEVEDDLEQEEEEGQDIPWSKVLGRKLRKGMEKQMEKQMEEKVQEQFRKVQTGSTRKRRVIVFGMKAKEEKTDKELIDDMVEAMGAEVRISEVIRMKKRDGEEDRIKPIIVEMKDETEKWKMLKNKTNLRNIDEYRRVFLDQDLDPVQREERITYRKTKREEAERKERKREERRNEETKEEH